MTFWDFCNNHALLSTLVALAALVVAYDVGISWARVAAIIASRGVVDAAVKMAEKKDPK